LIAQSICSPSPRLPATHEIDHQAAVFDKVDPSATGQLAGFITDDSTLQPNPFRTRGDCLANDVRTRFGTAEYVDQIDWSGSSFKTGVTLKAEHTIAIGIDWDDLFAGGQEVAGYSKTRTRRIIAQTHHRNPLSIEKAIMRFLVR
jgi:hypothetical protein